MTQMGFDEQGEQNVEIDAAEVAAVVASKYNRMALLGI